MIIDRLHTLTHKIPGVPAHGARTARPARPAHRNPHRSHAAHQHREPRVLAGWQRWIASLAERGSAKAGQD